MTISRFDVNAMPGQIYFVNADGYLEPINVGSLVDGSTIKYDMATQKWVLGAAGGGGGAGAEILIDDATSELLIDDATGDVLTEG